MIKIDELTRKIYYYVSNAKAETLTIIDGLCNTILKEIPIGKRPLKLALKDCNTIAVACDIDNIISLVDCISGEVKNTTIPNNGNLQIDTINKKIYVSNTSEINIYDINLKKLLGSVKGFLAIIDLRLNKDGSMLYVLDILLKELRIYETNSYKLINSFKNLGTNPSYVLVSKDDKTAYISMQHKILKIDIALNTFTNLILPKGSIIAEMILSDHILYVANKGLNRIELINIDTYKLYDFILTSTPEPIRLFITDDNTKLLVSNRNQEKFGGIDIIDTKSNCLIGSILMNSQNSQPYDVISLRIPYTYVPPTFTTELQPNNQSISIIAKKIFASYNENISFKNININLPKDIDSFYIYNKIEFKSGIVVENSKSMSRIPRAFGATSIKFIARVYYTIHYFNNNINSSINSFFEKPIDIIIDIPKERELHEFELNIKTVTNFINSPKIIDNIISFGVTTFMELKVVGEDEICIPNANKPFVNINEDFEEFSSYEDSIITNDSIFPSDTIIPFK
ncbi:YncE family protein [Clostridium lacusfryxellense]|uniref:YncE family protein n=1 Tax=Clostridium lacusfryxellense TaxID=205328 RepID=UPI001C0B39DD|nr:YncE family protein [Clostridium lacusfryxellense]MBU3114389.1 YncE family protein [Clostridium lacusfryxellense]